MALFAVLGGYPGNGRKTRFLTIFDDFWRFWPIPGGSPQEMPEMPENARINRENTQNSFFSLIIFTIVFDYSRGGLFRALSGPGRTTWPEGGVCAKTGSKKAKL